MKQVLIIGNIKEDTGFSCETYIKCLKGCFQNFEYLQPSTKFHPKLYKNFIYPLKLILKRNYKVYHILDHSSSFLINFLPKNKTIITCHDLIPLKENCLSFRAKIFYKYYISGLKKAKLIIAVSEQTKIDLNKYLKISMEKIKIKNPLYIKKITTKKPKPKGNIKRLICMGSGNYKNHNIILKSLKELIDKNYKVKLVKVGRFNDKQKDYISEFKLEEHIEIYNNITDEKLENLYISSDLLLFPSTNEGFGIPPLEAINYGIPVISSKINIIEKNLENSSILINPHDSKELTRAIILSLQNPKIDRSILDKFNKKDFKKSYSEVYR